VTGKTHRKFWKCFDSLSPAAQKLAREKYALWKRAPWHPSLKFEERRNGICVVRIGDHLRAIGLREGDRLVLDRIARRIQPVPVLIWKNQA
jgi:hypothetical protein